MDQLAGSQQSDVMELDDRDDDDSDSNPLISEAEKDDGLSDLTAASQPPSASSLG